jgi:hypothetical protein
MDVARRAAAVYVDNPKLAALTVAGSVGAGLADRYSDLELDCYWSQAPTDQDRQDPVKALGGELIRLWDYDGDEEEWSEDYRLSQLDVTVSNFVTSTIDHWLDSAVLAGWAAREALIGRGDGLAARHLLNRVGFAVAKTVLALNRVFLPHRQLKWQRHLLSGLTVVPAQLTGRLDQLVSSPLADAFQTAEQLLNDTVQLAETNSGADLTDFRTELASRRPALDPPRG